MEKIDDLVWEHIQHNTFQKGCYECSKENNLIQAKKLVTRECEDCNDTGIIMKDEWTGTDTSYEVAIRCKCQD